MKAKNKIPESPESWLEESQELISGHYWRICGRNRPNEKFSGKGHKIHVCKECSRLTKVALEVAHFKPHKKRRMKMLPRERIDILKNLEDTGLIYAFGY